jgi:tripartite-type tricarboxylate transporter receptor subunit TctC
MIGWPRAFTLLACLAISAPALAQSWPTRPIKLLVPTGAGTSTDVMARLFADEASRGLGQSLIVENLPGASGVIGARAAARAAPDGYTFFFANGSALTSNMFMLKNIGYDPTKDFDPVAVVTNTGPFSLTVPSSLPARTVAEFIGYAQANPGKVSYGVDATSGLGIVAGRLFNKRAGLGMTEVAYGATAQMLQDAAAGRIQLVVSAMSPVEPIVQQGSLRWIGLTSAKRFAGNPDIPLVAETTPGMVVDGWLAIVAPVGAPREAINRVNAEVGRYVSNEAIRKKLLSLGVGAAAPLSPEAAGAVIRAEQERWTGLAKELDLKPE